MRYNKNENKEMMKGDDSEELFIHYHLELDITRDTYSANGNE